MSKLGDARRAVNEFARANDAAGGGVKGAVEGVRKSVADSSKQKAKGAAKDAAWSAALGPVGPVLRRVLPVILGLLALLGLGALILSMLFMLMAGVQSMSQSPTAKACDLAGGALEPISVPGGSVAGYGPEQLSNAAQIMKAAKTLNLSVRDQQIGIMTAMGESALRVIDFGDKAGPDSRGLFQQRGNGAWGTYEDRMNPLISATNFYKAMLRAVPAGRDAMEPTLVAHKTQINADPYHYERFWEPAGKVLQALTDHSAAAVLAVPTAGGGSPAAASPGAAASRYKLGNVQPGTQKLADALGPQFGFKTIGGWRPFNAANHDDPKYGHTAGLALDFMTPDAANKSDSGDKLAAYLVANANQLHVEYIIWEQRIWSAPRAAEGWRAMGDRGGVTANHFDHVHLSLNFGGAGSAIPDTGAPNGPVGNCLSAAGLDVTAGGGAAGPVAPGGWAVPGGGSITSPYGPRLHPTLRIWKMHTGVDFSGGCHAPIWAAHDGTVQKAGPGGAAYGQWIIIDHGGGVTTLYGHMYANELYVKPGDTVKAGQLIARQGSNGWSTGCHLHFEVQLNGQHTNPVTYLTKGGATLP